MHSIALFDVSAVQPLERVAAALETPLGAIDLSFSAGAAHVGGLAQVAFRVGSRARVLVWDLPQLRAELLVVALHPELPPGMAVDGCRAGLWRVRADIDLDECAFGACWAAGRVPSIGGPSSGQMLAALTWRDGHVEVSLGAPDAEGLGAYERAGLGLPVSWRTMVLVEDPPLVVIEEYLPDGLRLRLPGLRAGEVGQMHFAVAWTDAGAQRDAPWFAVDILPGQILSTLGGE